jgi:hypothetical protein
MNLPPTAPPSTGPSCVMLLSIWAPPAARWHVRLVDLARFVAHATSAPPAADTSPPHGLR